MTRKLLLALPLLVFVLFVGAALWRLADPPSSTVASKLVGKPVPPFALKPALPTKPGFGAADLAGGQPRLVNLFASWCVPCIAEAPVLAELKARGVAIDGIAIRDTAPDITRFLSEQGDGYARIGADPNGQAQIALGASGVPESFIVDGRGIIRYHHIGAVMPQDVPEVMAEWEKVR
ncbi:DsbE family thiol:disulfide interchange protein [Sphingomonas sp. BN140010]|uniref:DsbE family thiol:disulfide interchange protein n=1 Tax=Sphingomonas arvum TaxID=2992113 RepID=A0ABT3JD40_9SPHN|nr:DsbE family thiol:disulfide interchange protein [Sphingomonas sp. BN140010]MCW3797001.1 DsbE family thiol:disulfide interchange protein [Sphingomonas sp. BN140010]